MKKVKHYMAAALSVTMLTSGCATAGGVTGGGSSGNVNNTVYQTHRMVQNIEQNLTGSVSTLTRTTAEIAARIDANEQETRRLVSLAQENQRKLDTLQATLDDLVVTMYRELNLSPPVRTTVPSQPSGGNTPTIQVDPPVTPQPESTTVSPTVTPTIETPTAAESPAADASQHYRSAQEAYSSGDFNAALQQFDEHLTTFPNSPHVANATYWKAHCYFKMGDYTQAVQGFSDLRSKYPSSEKVPIAMHNEAVAYSRLGNNDRAKSLFQQLIREYPDDVATEGARDKLRQLQGLSQ